MARPRKHPLPSIEELRARFVYNPQTGTVTIRARVGDDARTLAYNKRFANREVGTTQNLGYRFINVRPFGMLLGHRVVWALHHGEWPEGELDHRDGDKLNNRIDNLRPATRSENCRNRRGSRESGFRGVSRITYKDRWEARIWLDGKKRYLGSFPTEALAAEAYARAAREHHGEFAFHPIGRIAASVVIEALS